MIPRLLRSALFAILWILVWRLASRWLTSEAMAPTREDHRHILFTTGIVFGGAFFAMVDSLWEAAKRRRGGSAPRG
jgi:hypothetical protein